MRKVVLLAIAIVIRLKGGSATKAEVAEAVGYSADRVYDVLVMLRRAGVVEVVHGRNGGHRLAVSYRNITVGVLNNAIDKTSPPSELLVLKDRVSALLCGVRVCDFE